MESEATKYEVLEKKTWTVTPVTTLAFSDEKVTMTLESGEAIEFANKGEQGNLENPDYLARQAA